MTYLKVKNEKHLIRDTTSGAILNTDDISLQKYLKKRESIRAEKEKKLRQEEEINNLKKDVKEIKELVLTLVEALNANNKQ